MEKRGWNRYMMKLELSSKRTSGAGTAGELETRFWSRSFSTAILLPKSMASRWYPPPTPSSALSFCCSLICCNVSLIVQCLMLVKEFMQEKEKMREKQEKRGSEKNRKNNYMIQFTSEEIENANLVISSHSRE